MNHPKMTPSRVRLLREIVTEVGTYPAGTALMATRAPDAWLLHLSLPDRDGTVHLEPVPLTYVRYHARAATADKRKAAAHEDYKFARESLNFDDEQATLWLQREYRVSLKTLRMWGFHTAKLEMAERRARRAAS
ncbi:hypothetical protein [Nocardia sp. NPDC057030]|uniref:hypothetical protein n=1 Tax=unclassified Nocardia TaxID=2637762 RepID=UPI00363D84FB